MMEYYLELANNLRLASRLPTYSDAARAHFEEAASAIEDLVKRMQYTDGVLERASLRMRNVNEHLRDATEANEEIRNG